MKKYVCSVCGYIYDEAAGDPDNGIAPGTAWEDVRCAAWAKTSLKRPDRNGNRKRRCLLDRRRRFL